MKKEALFPIEDYDGLRFNVARLGPKADILQSFAELNIVPEFHLPYEAQIQRNKVLRYIIYVYDQESPFRKKFQDIGKRKYAVAMELGFSEKNNGDFREDEKKLMENKIPQFSQMIVAYLMISSNFSFIHLETILQQYANTVLRVFNDDPDVKLNELSSLKKEIEATTKEIFSDPSPVLKRDAMSILKYQAIELSPEHIARLLQEGRKFNAKIYA